MAKKKKAKRKVSAKTKAKRVVKRAEKAASRAGKKVKRKAKPLGKKVKRGAKKVGRKAEHFAKTDTGRAGIGAGVGALALGPVGAVAGAAAGLATRNPGARKRNVSAFDPGQFGGGGGTKPSKGKGSKVRGLASPGSKLERAAIRKADKERVMLEQTRLEDNPEPTTKVASVMGSMLLDYHKASPAIEYVAASALRGERVPFSILVRARDDLQALAKIQVQEAEREQMKDLVRSLDRTLSKMKRQRRGNPVRAFSLDTQIKRQRQSKAKKAAVGISKRSKVYSEVKSKSLASKLRKINPGESMLDKLIADFIKRRSRWMSLSTKASSSESEVLRAQRRMEEAERRLIMYADINDVSPNMLKRRIKRIEESGSKRKSNPLAHIPKGAGIRKIRSVVSKNIATEIDAGRPQKQAIAIAISSAQSDADRIGGKTAKLIHAEYPERNPKKLTKIPKGIKIKKLPPGKAEGAELPGEYAGGMHEGKHGGRKAKQRPLAMGIGVRAYGTANPKNKAKKKAKKKRPTTSEPQRLIRRCQKLWDHYCERPGKSRLKDVLKHLERMEGHASKKVKQERARCMKAAKAEAKRLKLKV